MKKIACLLSVLVLAVALTGCGGYSADYDTANFELALQNGESVEGMTVAVEVIEVVPNMAFGYNIVAGEHLNFVSYDDPQVEPGDIVVVRVERVAALFGTYVVTYNRDL